MGNAQVTINSGVTLTLASGALLITGTTNGASIVSGTGTPAGRLNFCAAEGIVRVDTGAIATISAPITGSGGLTITGSGTLNLPRANSFTGTTSNLNEVQTLTFGGTITSGTFTLTVNGVTTGTITWSTTPATLQAAIQSATQYLPR